jgi:hypothetical protein
MTRSHLAMVIGLLLFSTSASAQFKKYRSRTQESDGNTAKPADPAPSAPSGNNTNSNKPNDALSQQQQALRDIEDDSSNERETFGRENPSAPKVEKKEYVNLNFETAFGPEVVTSFDFPDADHLGSHEIHAEAYRDQLDPRQGCKRKSFHHCPNTYYSWGCMEGLPHSTKHGRVRPRKVRGVLQDHQLQGISVIRQQRSIPAHIHQIQKTSP